MRGAARRRGSREAVGTILNGIQMVMNEASPNLLLPSAVVTLDDGLEPGLHGVVQRSG